MAPSQDATGSGRATVRARDGRRPDPHSLRDSDPGQQEGARFSGRDTRFDVAALLSAERCQMIEIGPEREPTAPRDDFRLCSSAAGTLQAPARSRAPDTLRSACYGMNDRKRAKPAKEGSAPDRFGPLQVSAAASYARLRAWHTETPRRCTLITTARASVCRPPSEWDSACRGAHAARPSKQARIAGFRDRGGDVPTSGASASGRETPPRATHVPSVAEREPPSRRREACMNAGAGKRLPPRGSLAD